MTNGSDDDDKVGYKKPPRHSQFQKGQSGNPRGRAKSLRNLATDVKKMLETPVKVMDEGKTKRVSTQEAALLRVREKALKGNDRNLFHVVHLAQLFNPEDKTEPSGDGPLASDDQAILDAYAEEVRTRPSGRRVNGEGGADEDG